MELKAGLYQHRSGRFYQVLGLGAHCKTGELFVVAVALSVQPGPRMRLRSLSDWEEEIEWPDGSKGPRFKYVGLEPSPESVVEGVCITCKKAPGNAYQEFMCLSCANDAGAG